MPDGILTVGLDARPALFGHTGFARVVQQTLLGLRRRADVVVRPYAAAWRRARPDRVLPDVPAPRIPARLQHLLAPLGFGVESLLGPLDVYHHTDLVYAPVARTPEVLTLYDLVFLAGEPWHDPGFVRRVAPRVLRRARAATRVVVPSPQVADEVLARGLVPAARLRVVPLGSDHLRRAPGPDDEHLVQALFVRAGVRLASDDLLVLALGTREPRKNQLALLEAFLGLRPSRRAVLLFVGSRGWGCDALERRLEDRQLAGRADHRTGNARAQDARTVAVAGELDDEHLAALLQRADVVAYPSLAEGFGLPVAEAMRCGRAVLTSTGTPMQALGGPALRCVDPRDPSALRAGLRELLEDDALRRGLGEAARARIEPFTWDAHTSGLLSVYREAVS